MLLRSMRKGFFSALFLGLLVAGAAGLMLSDWNGFFRNGVTTTDVAKVDGEPVKIAEFNSRLTNALRAQNIEAAQAYELGIVDNVLQSEIMGIVMRRSTAKYGIRVADNFIAEQVRDIIGPFKTDGVSEKDALNKFLQMQGLSEQQLVSILRQETASNVLRNAISSASYIPSAQVAAISAFRNETRSVEYIFVPNSSAGASLKPTDADLKDYYETVKSSYMNPERRSFTVAVLDTSKLNNKADVAEADIKAFYDQNQDKFQKTEERTLEQAVLNDKKSADAVMAKVKSGSSIKEAVKTVTGNTKAYAAINKFEKAGLPTLIADPVFAAKEGDMVGPVQTPLGWHVIKVTAVTASHIQSYADVSAEIKKELEEQKSGDAYYEFVSEVDDRMAAGESFEDIAKEYSLTLTTIKDASADLQDIKQLSFAGDKAPAVLAKAFSIAENEPSSLSDINPKMLYSVRVDKITPASPQEFASIKDDLTKRWIAEKQMQANLTTMQKLVSDINDGKAKLSDRAEKLQTIKSLQRLAPEKADIPRDVAFRFMDAPEGKIIMASSGEKQGIYVGRVTGITLGKGDVDADFRKQLADDAANTNLQLFVTSLQKDYPIEINRDLLKRTYGQTDNKAE